MKNLTRLLVAISLGFVVFSIILGLQVAAIDFDDRYDEASAERNDLHSVVQVVSISYFLLSLVPFVVSLKARGRLVPIVGILVCVVMTVWSLILSGAVSFDEVYPAWAGTGVLLAVLQVMLLRAPATGNGAV
jgi:hypothetical protein